MADPLSALETAVDRALDAYIGDNFTVHDVVEAYGGDKAARLQLARDIAAYQGTAYKSNNQGKAVQRWLNYENGVRGSQARNPDKDPKTKEMLKDLYKKKARPPIKRVKVTGTITVSNDTRDRTVDMDPSGFPPNCDYVDAEAFWDAFHDGDMGAAWDEIFDGYVPGMRCDDTTAEDIEFDLG